MGRAPCCEKLGLKRGPWTIEEDRLLIAYIQQNGHGNWRALPKLAGLLRCGKSCRLRWTNYLKPDIKRGNFSQEEEDTIMKLHELLGNRWSTIAAKLPGRTDNEIKNVWHTHLKKRLDPDSKFKTKFKSKSKPKSKTKSDDQSPQPSSSNHSSEMESVTTVENPEYNNKDDNDSWDIMPSEILWPVDDLDLMEDYDVQLPAVPSPSTESTIVDENIEFWYHLLANAEELPELPVF